MNSDAELGLSGCTLPSDLRNLNSGELRQLDHEMPMTVDSCLASRDVTVTSRDVVMTSLDDRVACDTVRANVRSLVYMLKAGIPRRRRGLPRRHLREDRRENVGVSLNLP